MEKLVDTVVQRFYKPPLSSQKDACLVHIYPTGPWMGMRHALASQPLIVGRGEDCEIRVLDTSVSRRHARVTANGSKLFISEEVGALNGTFLNGKRLIPGKSEPLQSGDTLALGMVLLKLQGR